MSNYFHRNRDYAPIPIAKLPDSFFIVKKTVNCIAYNADHPLLCCVFYLKS